MAIPSAPLGHYYLKLMYCPTLYMMNGTSTCQSKCYEGVINQLHKLVNHYHLTITMTNEFQDHYEVVHQHVLHFLPRKQEAQVGLSSVVCPLVSFQLS